MSERVEQLQAEIERLRAENDRLRQIATAGALLASMVRVLFEHVPGVVKVAESLETRVRAL